MQLLNEIKVDFIATITGVTIAWVGQISTYEQKFDILVLYPPDFPISSPRVYPIDLIDSDNFKRAPHTLLDGSLCLAYPRFNNASLTASSVIPAAVMWMIGFESFVQTGKWLKEYPTSLDYSNTKALSKEKDQKLRIFVASSVEGLNIARSIQSELYHDFTIEIWDQDTVFGLGRVTIEVLDEAVKHYDFGIFVFTPDDMLNTRGITKVVARDNIIFELGLFIGKLGRLRAFVVHPSKNLITLPSDLIGMKTATYDPENENLKVALAPACEDIRSAIKYAIKNRSSTDIELVFSR